MSVDDLRKAQSDYSVAWLKFIQSYPKYPQALFCFFEGDDMKYYGIRIDLKVKPLDKYYLTCHGKQGVLRIADLIAKKYTKAWCAFFIDSDFDDPSEFANIPYLYVTPCYSVENLYVTKNCFCNILRSELKIDNDDGSDTDRCIATEMYTKTMDQLLNAMKLLNGWLFIQHKKAKEVGSKCLDINNLVICDLISCNLSGITTQYDYATIMNKCPNSHSVSDAELNEAIEYLTSSERIFKYRGKWLLQIFAIFIRLLVQDANKSKPVFFTRKYKSSLSISGNILSDLSQYADTPDCLIEYFNTLAQNKPV